jgi:cold-inducible RNA-binding protein
MNIFVGNLSKDVTDDDLQGLFSEFGQIKSVKVIRDIFSGESKGFGFVEMPGLSESQKAIAELNAKDVKGKKLVVNEARPKNDSRRPGGGGGRGSNNRGGGGSGRGGSRGGGGGRRGW